MTDDQGQSKGFGFVHFETQEAADNAINKVNGMLLADKKVFVGPFISRSQRGDGSGLRKFTNIYIKNFGDLLDDDKLRELLAPHGKITSCTVSSMLCRVIVHLHLRLINRSPRMKLVNRKVSAFAVSKAPKMPKR